MSPISRNATADVKSDFAFAEEFETEQLRFACAAIIRKATEKEDFKDGVDTVLGGTRMAHRVRRVSSCGSKRDITIRAYRKSGAVTELEKMKRGSYKSDLYLFAWVNDIWNNQVVEQVVVNVQKFIDSYLVRCREQRNRDGKTGFVYLPLAEAAGCITDHLVTPFELPSVEYCPHPQSAWIDKTEKRTRGWTSTTCARCNRWIGNRPQL